MKKIFVLLCAFLWPLTLPAMTPVSDSILSDVTGQAGVNINADLTMNIGIGTMAWGDSDGIGALTAYGWATGSTGGYVGVNNLNITNLRIKARETDTINGYLATGTTDQRWKPITIDVAQDAAMYDGATFVRLAPGSLEISMDAMSLEVGLGPRAATPVLDQVLGGVNVGQMMCYVAPRSYVDVYTRHGMGVNLTWAVYVDGFRVGYMSWADVEGLLGGCIGAGGVHWMSDSNAGYLGLRSLDVGPITVTGTTRIDVNTSYGGIYAHGTVGVDAGAAPVSVVHIGFSDNFTIAATGSITAEVKLDSQPDLNSVNAGTLGDIYMNNVSLNIADGSWVDVWAH